MPQFIPKSPVTLDEYSKMDMAQRRRIWVEISDIDDDELEAHMVEEKARETQVPQPGMMAPDFSADLLGPNRQRTGEQVRLSDLRQACGDHFWFLYVTPFPEQGRAP